MRGRNLQLPHYLLHRCFICFRAEFETGTTEEIAAAFGYLLARTYK